MKDRITPADPAWYTSFSHIIVPREDEWLAGLLLRCDEANNRESGGTLAYLLDASYYSRLTTGFRRLKEEHLEKLASRLALPLASIIATTYQAELARLSDGEGQRTQLSRARPPFHICPLCVAEDRLLSRQFTLPGITHCPQHQVLLATKCLCGKPLLPFDRYALPFTCGDCGIAWERLPRVQPERERIEREGKLLSYYEFFLSALSSALRLIADRQGTPGRRHRLRTGVVALSLEHLVGQLMELSLSPDDVQLSFRPDGSPPSESKKGGTPPG
jgi:TniQ